MDEVLRERSRGVGRLLCACTWVGIALATGLCLWHDRAIELVVMLVNPLPIAGLYVSGKLADGEVDDVRWLRGLGWLCVVGPFWLAACFDFADPRFWPVLPAYAACCAVVGVRAFRVLRSAPRPAPAPAGPVDRACVAASRSLWVLAAVELGALGLAAATSDITLREIRTWFLGLGFCVLLGWLAHSVARGRALIGAAAVLGTFGALQFAVGAAGLAIARPPPLGVAAGGLFLAATLAAIVLVLRAVLRMPPSIGTRV